MKRTRRHHSPEFKREAVALVVEQGYSCAAAGRSLGISGGMIGRWKTEWEGRAAEAFPGHGKRPAEHQRLQDLEAENHRLRMERDILKKATLSSTGRCNTSPKCLRWGLKGQGLSRALIQL